MYHKKIINRWQIWEVWHLKSDEVRWEKNKWSESNSEKVSNVQSQAQGWWTLRSSLRGIVSGVYVIFVGYVWLILYLIYIMIYIFCIYVAVFQMMIIWLWTIESKYDMPNILDRTFCFSLPMTGKHSPSWLVQIEEEERQKTGEEFQQKWEEWEEGRRMVACWSTNKQILEN